MTRAGRPVARLACCVVAALAVLLGTAGCAGSRHANGNGLLTVFMGDSITWGGTSDFDGRPGEQSWVRYVVEDPRSPWAYRADVAVSGETLGQMRERFRDDVLARDPEAVVLMGGTNDVLLGVPREQSLADLRWMVVAARGAGAEVWVVGFPPIDGTRADWQGLLAAEERLARELDVPFLRTDAAVTDPATGLWRDGLTVDGLHPTARGARLVAEAVLDGLDGLDESSVG